jgi:hypothetical protein
LPVRKNARWRFYDGEGAAIEVGAGDEVTLWHPLTASQSEADQWRARIIAEAIRQPFNQVFRETYRVDEAELKGTTSKLFSGYLVDSGVLQALARSAGWTLSNEDGFQLSLGDVQFRFNCGEVYPGQRVETETGAIAAMRGERPVNFEDIAPVMLSEVLRSVDLLVSVSAFALDPEEGERVEIVSDDDTFTLVDRTRLGSETARGRREVLRRIFGENERNDAPWIDGRYLRFRDLSIHLATGQARRNGEAVQLPKKKGAIKLPYEDPILDRIIEQVNAALHNGA